MPSTYDSSNLLPFLLINDHSILVIRHPRKDVAQLVKSLIGTGKYLGQSLNLTLWVVIDITCWLEKLIPARGITEAKQKKRKTIKDMIDKEFGIEFCQLFDLIIDVSQLSNTGLLGNKFL
jgi:hypothetical protein